MPPALENWEFQKYPTGSAKRKFGCFKNENNVANMNGIEPSVVSSNPTDGELWQHSPRFICFGDHRENRQDRCLPHADSSCLSRLSLIDERPIQTEEFPSVSVPLQKRQGFAENREVDRSKKNPVAEGCHRRQCSGDLYVKLEPFDGGDFVTSKDQGCSKFPSSSYIVKGHGSWGHFGDSPCSQDLNASESTSPKKAPTAKSLTFDSDRGLSLSGYSKEGHLLHTGTTGVGGVSGLKEWYKNRTLILKATSKVDAPPKQKYLRKLVLSSWKHKGAGGATIFNILSKRPIQSSSVIALKTLITIHKLMQQGPADCRAACYSRLQFLTDTVNTFQNRGGIAVELPLYGPLISAYASMLIGKATFHHRYQAYENNYSVDLCAVKDKTGLSGQTGNDPLSPEVLVCLQGLQDLILRTLEEGFSLFRKKYTAAGVKGACRKNGIVCGSVGSGLSMAGGDTDSIDLVSSVLIPVLREADLVYDICCFLLSTQFSARRRGNYGQEISSVLNEPISKFGYQHKALRTFFEEAKTIDAISCNVTPPNLPENSPYSADVAANEFSRLLPRMDCVAYGEGDTARHGPDTELDFLTEPESARPKSVPSDGTKNLQVGEDFVVRGTDLSWTSIPAACKLLPRQDMNGPVLGGVGAAAAAAVQRFAAGQAEARRAAAAAVSAADSALGETTGMRSIRLEPPPPGNGGNGFHVELGTIVRPGRPQHTRGTGRTWSSFDDEAFLHQHIADNPCSPVPRLVSPKFYSPRALGPSNNGVQHLSPVQMDSTSPLLLGFVGTPSPMDKPKDPFIGSPPSAILAMEPIPSPRLALGPRCQGRPCESLSPESQAQSRYPRVETPPLIELETVVEEQTAGADVQAADRAASPLHQDLQRNEDMLIWQMEGSMSDAAAWCDPQVVVGNVVQHSRKTSLSDIPFAADWEIPISELKLGPKIGQGAFGDVLRGTWQGTDVAVKRLQNNGSYSQAIVAIRHEVAVIMRLRHPNIILFMGACTVPPDICIVMEYAANGSLYGVLHNPNIGIDMATVVRWASEAARGMNYLHTRNPPIVHRDLKSVNLLVDGDWHIKVSDFGLAMTKQSSYAYSQVGTWGWMAPEVLESAPYDEKADVYSFGVVLWELITREEPFRGYHPMQIMRAIDRGERPAIPESCPHTYKQLVQDCWQKDPNGRPVFEEILGRLGAMSINLFKIQ
ncbi:hypothetical protein R1flu_026862 [Riccia fluitans]|uniref:non-specific serine/threonine protein kinase n=1 Tax=Riccia fluitans TaxID=41844 RepID=A0ABD1XH39_9MARC